MSMTIGGQTMSLPKALNSKLMSLTISEWLGHSDITNTMIYIKLIARDSTHFINQVRF